jgi:hypothetical protein
VRVWSRTEGGGPAGHRGAAVRKRAWYDRWTAEGDRLLGLAMGVVPPPPGIDGPTVRREHAVAGQLRRLEALVEARYGPGVAPRWRRPHQPPRRALRGS